MIDPTAKPLAVLLRMRRQEEELAAQAFGRARADAEAIRRDVAATRELLVEQNRRARAVLVDRPAPRACAASAQDPAGRPAAVHAPEPPAAGSCLGEYRKTLADLQAVLTEEQGRLREAEQVMEDRREAFIQAMQRRKAVGKGAQRRSQRQARKVDRWAAKELDDAHAAFHAGQREPT